MRTRSEMEQIIGSGGSVVYQGRIISNVQDLPSDAEIANASDVIGDDGLSLQQQIAELQAQLLQLQEQLALAVPEAVNEPPSQPTIELTPELAERLAAAGYTTPEQIAAASDEELLAIDGIGPASLKRIRGKA